MDEYNLFPDYEPEPITLDWPSAVRLSIAIRLVGWAARIAPAGWPATSIIRHAAADLVSGHPSIDWRRITAPQLRWPPPR